ncbi:MAG TPA: hypothetical protein VN873_06490 [Candidatus Angelobacter sp.]|nr:hypothetical protein [Candidatus Angelobacter sp.]
MTVIADSKKRVVLPPIQPGDRFDVQVEGEILVLTKLVPAKERPRAKVRFDKENGVAETNQPISLAAIKEVLSEFP